ncbi:phytoene synthase [Sulfitobacter sp. SK012]|uniref:squalene/phytoene synthase family protein n=1 Tax=Sulfitobacter sp. SK012 TaxID=1389005 RepID=UPI000E0AA333|nr:squalene/phytoene synthase family protein [Sulfitobacter sp. SK012]AXI48840.1 phytoene synthase [Sulfitobacter sp. SK012]
MSFDADLNACAALVEKGDPLRFRCAMAAPLAARRVLFPLYAFNVEVARAPWVTQEPMIAEMRLQWWRDALEEIAEGGTVRRHEVTTPLAAVLSPDLAKMLDALVASRRFDIYRDPFEDEVHFERFVNETSGHLMWAGASLLGHADEATVRNAAYAAGIANWLRAILQLEKAGRVPLLDGTAAGVRALAQDALNRLGTARSARRSISSDAAPAILPAAAAGPVLRAAVANPNCVADGLLPEPGLGFTLRAALRRW